MEIIDPLLIRIEYLLSDGRNNPLETGRQKFGSDNDLQLLERKIQEVKNNDCFLLDLTPYQDYSFVLENNFNNSLKTNKTLKPIIITYSYKFIQKYFFVFEDEAVPCILLDNNGNIVNIFGNSSSSEAFGKLFIKNEFVNINNISDIRFKYSNNKLFDLITQTPKALEEPYGFHSFPVVKYKNKKYLKMLNDMVVNKYLRPKEFGVDYKILIYIAYEIAIRILDYFKPNYNLPEDMKIVVSNNTSLFLTSLVQTMLEKEIFVVDRIGPIPNICPPIDQLIKSLYECKIIFIQEVQATGRETDSTQMFLDQMHAVIEKAIVIYNLEAGRPLLVNRDKTVCLCKPKIRLEYELSSYYCKD